MYYLANGLVSHWSTPNLSAHIYAIGWFGSLWNVEFVAEHLRHEKAEVRRVALFAFSRLAGRSFFDDVKAALWWDVNKDKFPSRHDVDDTKK